MHDCTSCGGACYCHGDIDDCPVETPEYSDAHCSGCGCHEDGELDPEELDFDPDTDEDYARAEELADEELRWLNEQWGKE